jgi:micrococcal nuclease
MGALAALSGGDRLGSDSQLHVSSSPSSTASAGGGISTAVTGHARVRDGDTIEVGGVPVRLQGLHCPEVGELGGGAAANAMQSLIRGSEVRCTLTGEWTHNRVVGSCRAGNTDLAETLIREGFCARCPRYDPGGRYAAAQREADAWTRSMPGYCR